MAKKLNLAVIFGGRSGEHEVSLVSAKSIIGALDPAKYDVLQIGIAKDGKWYTGEDVLEKLKSGKTAGLDGVTVNMDCENPGFLISEKGKIIFRPIDIAFPVLHGPYGEDGTIQGLFEMAGIPYVGCGVGASAVCMDKYTTKLVFASYGLPQVEFMQITKKQFEEDKTAACKKIAEEIGFPCFVKPANLGSSVGISKVKKAADAAKALAFAAEFDCSVIVEQAVANAREIECAVLGNSEPKASTAGEVVPGGEFYDYYAKYVDDNSKLFIPAQISKTQMQTVQKMAVKAYSAAQCSGLARVDFLMDAKTGKIFLNEINTLPGFTSISMYPKMWEASGLPYKKLLDELIKLGLERFSERQKNKISFDSGSDWYRKS